MDISTYIQEHQANWDQEWSDEWSKVIHSGLSFTLLHQDVDVVGSPSCQHDMTGKLIWQSQIFICHVVQNGFPLNFILIVVFNFQIINCCMNYNMSYFIVIQCQVRPCHKKNVGQFTMKFFFMNFAFPWHNGKAIFVVTEDVIAL